MLNTISQVPLNQIYLDVLYAGLMSIGSRLRQLRKANNLSGDKFGELCGVTKGMVSQWESDAVTPATDRLLELHRHLNFSFDWLLNGKDDATVYSTSDPTLMEILKVLEPRAEYFKETALKTVLSTIDLVDHVQTNEKDAVKAVATSDHAQQPQPVRVRERELKKKGITRPAFIKEKKNA